MAKKRRQGAKRLTPEMEVSTDRRADTIDPDVGAYVKAFVDALPDAVRLEQFSLATPEDALKALSVIEDTRDRLERQQANIKALQKLLSS